MSVFKYFKNIPRSPSHRATGPKCNFFLQICNEVPGEKKGGPVAPLNGRQAPVAPGVGDRGPSAAVCRHSFCDLSLKIQKKTSPSRHSLLWLPCCHIFLKWWKGTAILSHMSGQKMRYLGNPWSPEHNKFTSIVSIECDIRACSRPHCRQDLGR